MVKFVLSIAMGIICLSAIAVRFLRFSTHCELDKLCELAAGHEAGN